MINQDENSKNQTVTYYEGKSDLKLYLNGDFIRLHQKDKKVILFNVRIIDYIEIDGEEQ